MNNAVQELIQHLEEMVDKAIAEHPLSGEIDEEEAVIARTSAMKVAALKFFARHDENPNFCLFAEAVLDWCDREFEKIVTKGRPSLRLVPKLPEDL